MTPLEYRTRNKSDWGDGPWSTEPDKLQWKDEATGLPCLIVRNYVGALCGYVGVTIGHSAFGMPYSDVDVRVHGGLTFADFCQTEANQAEGICHVPGPGDPERVWWLGFDCAHYNDYVPGMPERYRTLMAREGSQYRTVEYVKEEIQGLAQQLAKL